MKEENLIYERIQRLWLNVDYCLNLLYGIGCYQTRVMVLNQVKNKIQELEFLYSILNKGIKEPSDQPSVLPPGLPPSLPNQRIFSLAELATYTGQNGQPAFIAVNSIVYDVTDNAAWAAASHFGLRAGRDLTSEFYSCHSGQQGILSQLPMVGRLV